MLEHTELEAKVKQILAENKIVLFMKGEKDMPACGFSAGVVEVLNRCGVDFVSINILADEHLRSFMKEYSNWPTYPQLYVNQELVGGYDIVVELYESGELQQILV